MEVTPKITFESLLSKIKNLSKKTIAVICPENEEIMQSVKDCIEICNFILIGDESKIIPLTESLLFPKACLKIINCIDPIKATEHGLTLVHSKEADMLMKGTLSTKDILKVCFKDDIGIKVEGKLITNVSLFELPNYPKMLMFSDPAIIIKPTLENKISMIENLVQVGKSIGIFNPKIAVLAAIEDVNPKMIETVEAKKLSEMNDKGEIKECIVDGPLSLDIAMDPKAAEIKGAEKRKIAGDADCLLFPEIHSANFAYKIFTHLMNAKCANVIVGTQVPIVLSSRADTSENKKNSILLACYLSEFIKN